MILEFHTRKLKTKARNLIANIYFVKFIRPIKFQLKIRLQIQRFHSNYLRHCNKAIQGICVFVWRCEEPPSSQRRRVAHLWLA